jgi:hypothetical protein
MIPVFTYILLAVTFTGYTSVLTHLMPKHSMEKDIEFKVWGFINILWTISNLSLVVIPIRAAESMKKEALKSKEIGYEMLKRQKLSDDHNLNYVELSLTFFIDDKFQLQTIFFNIDWKLLFNLISTAATFIIISCQFNSANDISRSSLNSTEI